MGRTRGQQRLRAACTAEADQASPHFFLSLQIDFPDTQHSKRELFLPLWQLRQAPALCTACRLSRHTTAADSPLSPWGSRVSRGLAVESPRSLEFGVVLSASQRPGNERRRRPLAPAPSCTEGGAAFVREGSVSARASGCAMAFGAKKNCRGGDGTEGEGFSPAMPLAPGDRRRVAPGSAASVV